MTPDLKWPVLQFRVILAHLPTNIAFVLCGSLVLIKRFYGSMLDLGAGEFHVGGSPHSASYWIQKNQQATFLGRIRTQSSEGRCWDWIAPWHVQCNTIWEQGRQGPCHVLQPCLLLFCSCFNVPAPRDKTPASAFQDAKPGDLNCHRCGSVSIFSQTTFYSQEYSWPSKEMQDLNPGWGSPLSANYSEEPCHIRGMCWSPYHLLLGSEYNREHPSW